MGRVVSVASLSSVENSEIEWCENSSGQSEARQMKSQPISKSTQGLDDLCIPPVRFLSNSNDCVAERKCNDAYVQSNAFILHAIRLRPFEEARLFASALCQS